MAKPSPQQVGSVYPWRKHTRCELLVDPQVFMPALLQAIGNAREYVLLEMYLTESGTTTTAVIDALIAAAGRGVSIYIVFDSFGARHLGSADRARLKHRNIEMTFYHPVRLWALRYVFVRDHRKLLLVDGRVAFSGSMGFSDGIELADGRRQAWHDTVVRFEGKVCADWQALFAAHWKDITSIELSLDEPATPAAGDCSARVIASQPAQLNPIYGHLRQRAGLAANRLWIATAYFLPSWRLRRAMHKAAERGVDVRLLLPGKITDNAAVRYASQGFYSTLLNSGVRIYEYQPTFQHGKVAVVDNWVSVGSSNFDRWSMARNLETNLEVLDDTFADKVAAMFERDFADSEEIATDTWTERPLLQRWRENLWGTIEMWTSKPKR